MLHTYTIRSVELSDVKATLRGPEYLSCLHDLVQEFRKKAKYEEPQTTTWEEAYQLLWRTINDHAVNPLEE